MENKQKCSTCRYFYDLECHVRSVAIWPIRDYEDYCGEWNLNQDFIEDKIRIQAIDHGNDYYDS